MKLIGLVVAACFIGGCANEGVESPSDTGSSTETSIKLKDKNSEEKRISFMGVGDNLIHNVIFEEAQLNDGTFDFRPMFENVADDIGFIRWMTILKN